LLRDPDPVENVDFLQIESTYGNRTHLPRNTADNAVMKPALETLKRGGKVIIPAFAVGRTQQIVYTLNKARRAEQYPDVPVFVDSPLAVNATEVHRLHPECFNAEVYKFLEEVANPFEMDHLTYIRQVSESKKLNELKGPAIIISASGMAEAGRILHHLKNNIGDPGNLILFVGYCAEHTLGAQILAGRSPVNIFGEPQDVRARVASIDSLSGHADKNELKAHVERLTGSFQKIYVIHGEEEQSLGFAAVLRQVKPDAEVVVPVPGQQVEI
jgi:metallo-beta-lactamase family protein